MTLYYQKKMVSETILVSSSKCNSEDRERITRKGFEKQESYEFDD